MKTISLTKGHVALVDDEDFERVSKHKWCAADRTRKPERPLIYGQSRIDDKLVYLHTFISGFKLTDHRDHNGLNNQKHNLRDATKGQNAQNSAKITNRKGRKTTSTTRGVSWDKNRKKWRAYIVVEGKQLNLGRFLSETEAVTQSEAAMKKHFGDFAYSEVIACP